MNELRKLWIEGPAGRLEAALRVSCPARGAAAIAHPHPLRGGTLHNPIVFHADRELWRHGLTTLRFNFRGVGTSEGAHDEGKGEIEDVGAAVRWLRGIAPQLPLVCVGYSFGAYCSLRWTLNDETVKGLIAVGMPVSSYDFGSLESLDRPVAVVQGSADELGSPQDVQDLLSRRKAQSELIVIDNATHALTKRGPEVGRAVAQAALQMLGAL